uniref:ADP,ATP carrier protein n=1 Tax=Neobodo designis TaxID=312471 RepID=A0A7S1QTJ2_NEODS|mmetsp:Transcript_52024/g.160287  ORF Transcript_52024/g.160287 Transcript_52024/m.160287 type:complete len:184 (+) Transcript_52024:1-552(+)
MTGVAVTAIRHPYDVLRATAEHPSAPVRFKGPLDVLVQTAKQNPKFLAGLYNGGLTSCLANVLHFGGLFGTWELTKYDGAEASWQRQLFYAYASVLFGHTLQYPIHFTKQALHEYNRTKRFGGVTMKGFLLEQRKRTGVTVLYTGFFSSKPLIGCVPGALTLWAFDYGKRWLWEQQVGPQKRV